MAGVGREKGNFTHHLNRTVPKGLPNRCGQGIIGAGMKSAVRGPRHNIPATNA